MVTKLIDAWNMALELLLGIGNLVCEIWLNELVFAVHLEFQHSDSQKVGT